MSDPAMLGRGALDELAALAAAEFADGELSRECIERVIFDDPDADPRLILGVRAGGNLVAAAAAVLRRPAAAEAAPGAPPAGHVKLLLAPASSAAFGALLDRVETLLASGGAAAVEWDGAAPRYFRPGLPAACAAELDALRARGYRVIGERTSAVVRLDAPSPTSPPSSPTPPSSAPADVAFERAATVDAPRLRAEIAAAFSTRWADEAAQALAASPARLHIARAPGGGLAGFAAHGVSGPDVFGPMGTLPAWRGCGVGAELLRRALADLRAAGRARAIIGWLGPLEYYRRRAPIERVLRYHVLRKELRP